MTMIETDYGHLSPQQAVALQESMRQELQLTPLQQPVTTIGGADISFNQFSDEVYAGIVILEFPSMHIIHRAYAVSRCSFPYVPGLLAFREVPALIKVWEALPLLPDVLVLDGHGIAHPRGMGIATHFGIVAGTPTIGCAKSLLAGRYQSLMDVQHATTDLLYRNQKIGEVLRTKPRTNPVFVSPGHLITQEESTAIIKQCVTKYRIPEPTRQAHIYVNEVRLAGQ